MGSWENAAENAVVYLRRKEYERRLVVNRLRREVFQQLNPSASDELLQELLEAEQSLRDAESERANAQEADPSSGLIVEPRGERRRRGMASTGLETTVQLNMAQLPTSIYHLLDAESNPLITCEVRASRSTVERGNCARRVRVTSYVEGYSAHSVDTFEVPVNRSHTVRQLPTLFPDRVRAVTELTRATLKVVVEDLDGEVELHETEPVWLLPRTSAALEVTDPQSGRRQDMTRYLSAFVTPNAPSLMEILKKAAHSHPEGRLVGYQGNEADVEPQVKAVYGALKAAAKVSYISSAIDFNPDQGSAGQRVRLPRESLENKEANCVDSTVLVASLLEGISLNPAIVLVPGHAFLAWETWRGSDGWRFLETTMIGSSAYEAACASAEKTAAAYKQRGQLTLLPLKELRAAGIMPME